MSLSSKVLSFARDKNDFFCTHELGAFYNGDDFGKLSAIVGRLKQIGKLTMTDVQEPCKMQSKKHHFYIYNKRQNEEKPKIDEDRDDNLKTEISKNKKEIFDIIKESVLKQTGEFCRHTIAKETNISAKVVAPYLKKLREKRKLKYIGKKDCSEGFRIHKFYIVVNKNLKNVKVGSNTKTCSNKNEKPKYSRWKDRIPEIKKMMNEGKTDREIGKFYGYTRKSIKKLRQRYGLLRTSRTIEIFQKPIKIEKTEGDLGVFIQCLSCHFEYLDGKQKVMDSNESICPRCQHKIVIGSS
jgi:DNA-directed RNA polymerase subunit RPC12/RpoP